MHKDLMMFHKTENCEIQENAWFSLNRDDGLLTEETAVSLRLCYYENFVGRSQNICKF